MNRMNNTAGLPPTAVPAPYNDLHIYYLEGRVPRGHVVDSDDYIGTWEEDGDTFVFFSAPAPAAVHAMLAAEPSLRLVDRYEMTYDEWQGGRLVPERHGPFRLIPPWHPAPPMADTVDILMDPGVVFGAGTHPTTQDCLAAIDRASRRLPLDRVLDLGTGTGVLAIAAAKSGAARVLAVDTNFLAARTARDNVRRNRLEDRIAVVRGDAVATVGRPVDLLIANIHYDVMKRMLAADALATCKMFILSGLLRSEARLVTDRLATPAVRIIDKWERDGIWYTFLGESMPP